MKMTKNLRNICILGALSCVTVSAGLAQLKVTNAERLAVGGEQAWSSPRFSPDGKAILFTTTNYRGIWRYELANRTVRQITEDPGAGFGYSISPDGSRIAYRRSRFDAGSRERVDEAVVVSLDDGSSAIVAKGPDLALPVFSGTDVVASAVGESVDRSSRPGAPEATILGIENTKIALLRGGKKVLLDPLGNGSYVWPSLSPDKEYLVAYEADRGAFVCDMEGKVISRLGRRDAAVWTRNGRWLVYMNDTDDGHQILSSDIFSLSPDGTQVAQLTDTPDILEMYPDCSPTDDRIVCSTPNGEIYLITYTEVAR